MPLDADTIAEMARRIEAMQEAASGWGVTGPYTVHLPKPLFDALHRSGRLLPYDVRCVQDYKPKKTKLPRGMRGRTRTGL